MTKKNHNPQQGHMFERSFLSGAENPVKLESPALQEQDGISVSIEERAQRFSNALDHLAQVHMRTGLQIASTTNHRNGLVKRYGNSASEVVDGSVRNRELHWRASKQEFAHLFGLPQMIGSGLISEYQAKKMARESFRQFSSKYGEGMYSPERTKHKNQVLRAARIIVGASQKPRKKARAS